MPMELPEEASPEAVELDRANGSDGALGRRHLGALRAAELRVNCPCAECRGKREQGAPIWPRPGAPEPLAAVGAELVGAWGLTVRWNDGHETGIFSWGLLRNWAGAGDEGAGEGDRSD